MKREQTAVEMLIECLIASGYFCEDELPKGLFAQAKQMEKEQIVKAAANAFEDMFGSDGTDYGLKYYNERYENKAENNG